MDVDHSGAGFTTVSSGAAVLLAWAVWMRRQQPLLARGTGMRQRHESPSCPRLAPWRSDQARARSHRRMRSRHESRQGIDLIIHHQQRGAPGINVRKIRHGFLLPDDEFCDDVTNGLSMAKD